MNNTAKPPHWTDAQFNQFLIENQAIQLINVPNSPFATVVNEVNAKKFGLAKWVNLPLISLSKKLCGNYNPSRFAAMCNSIQSWGSKINMSLDFSTGGQVCTGAISEVHMMATEWKLCDYMNNRNGMGLRLGYLTNFTLCNMVCQFKGTTVDVRKLATMLGSRAIYEERLIHCCRIRSPPKIGPPKSVILVYKTGSGIVTGIQSKEEARKLYEYEYKNIRKCETFQTNSDVRGKQMQPDVDQETMKSMQSGLDMSSAIGGWYQSMDNIPVAPTQQYKKRQRENVVKSNFIPSVKKQKRIQDITPKYVPTHTRAIEAGSP